MTHDYREVCSCGHAKATHFHGPPTVRVEHGWTVTDDSAPCLGLACECKDYEPPNDKEYRHAERERYTRPY